MAYKDKELQRAAQLAYYYRNKERIAEYRKKWRAENKEKRREYDKKWAAENPEKKQLVRRRYRHKHKEKLLQKKRAAYRNRPEVRERHKEKKRSWNRRKKMGVPMPPPSQKLPAPPPEPPRRREYYEAMIAQRAQYFRMQRKVLHRLWGGVINPDLIDKLAPEMDRRVYGGYGDRRLLSFFVFPNYPRPQGASPIGPWPRVYPSEDEALRGGCKTSRPGTILKFPS